MRLLSALALASLVPACSAVLPYGHAFSAPGDFSPAQYAYIADAFPLFLRHKPEPAGRRILLALALGHGQRVARLGARNRCRHAEGHCGRKPWRRRGSGWISDARGRARSHCRA